MILKRSLLVVFLLLASRAGLADELLVCNQNEIPPGYVIVGYTIDTKCAHLGFANPDTIRVRPAFDGEQVCYGTPVPSGYFYKADFLAIPYCDNGIFTASGTLMQVAGGSSSSGAGIPSSPATHTVHFGFMTVHIPIPTIPPFPAH